MRVFAGVGVCFPTRRFSFRRCSGGGASHHKRVALLEGAVAFLLQVPVHWLATAAAILVREDGCVALLCDRGLAPCAAF